MTAAREQAKDEPQKNAENTKRKTLINFGSYEFQIKKYVLSDRSAALAGALSALLFSFLAFFAFLRGKKQISTFVRAGFGRKL